ncbi:zinc-binding dehydrogenase [Planctomycetota bacterium]
MRTVTIEGNSSITVINAPDPVPGPGEVLIDTAVSALCGSELGSYRGKGMKSGNSGHEAAGVVSAIGEGVADLEVGQRVGVSAIAGCGNCPYCARGQYTWCPDRKFYGSMHAERFLAAANACHRLPDDIPWDVGVLVSGDGLGVPFHTSTKIDSPDITTIAVIGAGPIGLGSVLLQSYLGRRVAAVDVSPPRLELSTALGAERVFDANEADAAETIREWTRGTGADACIEAAGCPGTLKQCFAAVRPGGTVAINGEQPSVELSPSNDFIRRDITALGAWYYHFSEFENMVALCRDGLQVEKLITNDYSLEEADEAFKEFASGTSGKIILRMKD